MPSSSEKDPTLAPRVCQWVNQSTALKHFARYDGPTQSQQHIKPLHWYVACRLVLEGGFHPDELKPRPPFTVTRRRGQYLLDFEPGAATGGEATVRGEGDAAVAGEDEGAGMRLRPVVDRKSVRGHHPERAPGAHHAQRREAREDAHRAMRDVAARAGEHRGIEAAILLRRAEQQRTLVGLTHPQGRVAEPRLGALGDDDLSVLGMHRHVESDHRAERFRAVAGRDDHLAAGDRSPHGAHVESAALEGADVVDARTHSAYSGRPTPLPCTHTSPKLPRLARYVASSSSSTATRCPARARP